MSAEEDTELRDLVAQSLESKGVLGKIRAQLRASVFLVLDEQENAENKIPLSSPNLKKFLNTAEGRLVTGLVREFLEFFDLDFTIAVFDPESSFNDRYQGRNNLANELNLHDAEKFSNKPLLLEVVQRLLHGGNSTTATAKQPTTTNDTQQQAKSNSWQNGPISPWSSSPSSISKDEDDHSRSELMISAGFKSDDDDDEYMKPSKIPQRIKDDKPRSTSHSIGSENGLDHYSDGKLSAKDKSLSDSRKEQSGRGSPDRTLGSDDDDDIFNEFMSKQKPSYQPSKAKKEITGEKKPLDKIDSGPKSQGVLSSLKGAPSLSGGSGLGSLKDAPPLTGTAKPSAGKDLTKSPDWNDLADIDNRINRLGFDLPGDEKSAHSQDYEYEDDFQPSSEHSLTEEIEEQLSSYHSNSSSKADDLLTTDRTVSHASDSGLDYAEDILDDF